MACIYCGGENTYVWNGKEICISNDECLDKAVLESDNVQYLVEKGDE